jgi:hypothetical protein
LFAAITGGDYSEIAAIDLSDPLMPSTLYRFGRGSNGKAACVGVTHRRHGTWGYVMAVPKSGAVDFYLKDHDDNNFATIRENEKIPWRLIRADVPCESYEGCGLVTARNGTLYFFGLKRRGGWSGEDYVDLYRINRFNPEARREEDRISLIKVAEKHMYCRRSGEDWCSLKAATGIYVNPGAGERIENAILIYSANYRDQSIRRERFQPFMEFNAGVW